MQCCERIFSDNTPDVSNSGVNMDHSCLRTCILRSSYLVIQRLGDFWCSVGKSIEVSECQSDVDLFKSLSFKSYNVGWSGISPSLNF
jgi:hypothetical protein